MNILWVLNKYVEGKSLSKYYPDFLRFVEEEAEKQGHKVYFVFFSDAMRDRAKTKNNLFYLEPKIKDYTDSARRLEREYGFTFRQAYFAEAIQLSKKQDYRTINLPQKELESDFLVPRFLYLEKIIDKKQIDVVLCDQSAEAEMEFARSICFKKNKIFLRNLECFLGRSIFAQQFSFGHERVALPIIDRAITMKGVKEYVDDFVKNNRLPYTAKEFLKADFKEFWVPRILQFYKYPQFLKIGVMWPYLMFEDKVLKALMRKKFDKTKPYFYFGFHLPSESTVALRALPFMTQVFLVESISRVLPKGYYLYVREHPSWKTHFPYSRLKHLRKLPNVRLISTRIPINEILKNSRGLITYNATTGIEALMYGKPVLAFAANVYSGLHSGASLCLDLYEAGERLARLPETKVDKDETYRYIYKLMRASTEMTLAAGTFLSVEDSARKSRIFAKALITTAKYCREHKIGHKN